MMFYKDEVVDEVRQTREELLKEYGGIAGLHKHQDEERPQLEKEGWIFVAPPTVDKDFMAAVRNDLKAWENP
ncbi:hypothetical protein AGMMS49546_20260 [Spirochaetia bacterium]|nr:hypothetical protein AGMMS49546_20260 [Spirochaetia bacterium]